MFSSPIYASTADFLGIVPPGSSTIYSAVADPVPGGRPVSSPIYAGVSEAGADNTITFGQIVAAEVVRLAANTITFGQIIGLELIINVGNSITFGQELLSNTVFVEVGNSITFGQVANTEQALDAGNIITFQSIAVDAAIKESASNALNFGQILDVNKVISLSVGNQITFGQLAFVKDFNFDLENTLTFGQIVSPNIILNISVGNIIRFAGEARNIIEAVVSNLITFTGSADRAGDPSNAIVFGQIVVVVVSSRVNNSITFGQILAAQVTLNIAVGNQITFGNRVLGTKLDNCNLQEYNPANSASSLMPLTSPAGIAASSVKFECSGSPDLILRNPIFSNTTGVDPDRVFARSRGGTLGSFRDQTWPKDRQLTVTFTIVKIAKRDEIETFLKFCLGKLITYTDMETRIWEGIIINPTTALSEVAGNQYSATLELSVTPQ